MKDTDNRIFDQELIDSCIVEFREHIDEAVRNILLLEKDPEDIEATQSLFRNFHTIKGNASVVGFEKIIRLSHEVENLLYNIQNKTIKINSAIIETLLMSADIMGALVDEFAGGDSFDESKLNDFVSTISNYLSSETSSDAPRASETRNVPSLKILIVDDELVSRKKAQKILSQYGECDVAISGIEAIKAFRLAHEDGNPYDFITMDIIMSDMDGIEALKQIRKWEESRDIQIGQGVKVAMLTATKTSDPVFSSFKEGCEAYIVKPFIREDLANVMTKLGLI